VDSVEGEHGAASSMHDGPRGTRVRQKRERAEAA
jgi:hypothetical protein